MHWQWEPEPAEMIIIVDSFEDGSLGVRWKQQDEGPQSVISIPLPSRTAVAELFRKVGLHDDGSLVIFSDAQNHFEFRKPYDDDVLTALGLRGSREELVEKAISNLREKATK